MQNWSVEDIKKSLTEYVFDQHYSEEADLKKPWPEGVIFVAPDIRVNHRAWITKVNNEQNRGNRTIILITISKNNCAYFTSQVLGVAQCNIVPANVQYHGRMVRRPTIIAKYPAKEPPKNRMTDGWMYFN